ncbi:hypothetical protein M3P36_02930 [Altererythrobacter sp. KTW20L]|uniref:hypothetical protein n=1 Tax=Altererythrobacter sp. KTW20L TaxID=2942210 RepID=UPI0020BE2A98|nr:hypothetical protein [Altererythrobacter sp. KTW20L]MCL6250006.1 hypothetical protein [Altererythrobacter sp. KTW20L]
MLIEVSSHLPIPPALAWEQVQSPQLLQHIAAPLLTFHPRKGAFPETWQPREYRAGLRLFGILPVGEQVIGIEYPEHGAPEGGHVLRDNGRGGLVTRWDHLMLIAPENGGTRYTDRVEIEAGAVTGLAAAFARYFYRHRQKRWLQLITRDYQRA